VRRPPVHAAVQRVGPVDVELGGIVHRAGRAVAVAVLAVDGRVDRGEELVGRGDGREASSFVVLGGGAGQEGRAATEDGLHGFVEAAQEIYTVWNVVWSREKISDLI